MKEFADDNFKSDENGIKFSKKVRKQCGKRRNFSFPYSVLQTRKNKGLFGKGLNPECLTGHGTVLFWLRSINEEIIFARKRSKDTSHSRLQCSLYQ